MSKWCKLCSSEVTKKNIIDHFRIFCQKKTTEDKKKIEEINKNFLNRADFAKSELESELETQFCQDTKPTLTTVAALVALPIFDEKDEFYKQKMVIKRAQNENGVRQRIKNELRIIFYSNAKLANFDFVGFGSRMDISGSVSQKKIFYRKMALAEYSKTIEIKGKFTGNPFGAAFSYTDKAEYRYWMSTSLKKVMAFGNENSSSSGSSDVITKITFSENLLEKCSQDVKMHQTRGVQADVNAVALHREGFAELGNLDQNDLKELLEGSFDFNLGFTSKFSVFLLSKLSLFEIILTV